MQEKKHLVQLLIGGAGCLLLLVVLAFASVLVATNPIKDVIRQVNDLLNPRPAVTVVSSATIINSIQPLAELVTMRVELAKINVQVNVNYGTGSGCSHTARYAVAGEFHAGIDLGQLQPEAITYEEVTNTYKVRLPGAKLTDCSIRDSARYEVVGMGICPGGANREDTEPLAKYVALNEFRDEVLENGLLDRAQREAQTVLTNFVTSLVTVNNVADKKPVVLIEFDQQDSVRPASCQPEPPGGWTLESETNQWKRTS